MCDPFAMPDPLVTRLLLVLPALTAAIVAMGLSSLPANAAEIRVSPSDKPHAQPISDAIKLAAPGDVLIVEPGAYRESLDIGKPLTLRGLPGATLEGSEPLALAWEPAGGDLPGVYTAESGSKPVGLLWDRKFIAEIRFDKAQKEGDWQWQTLLAKGTPLSHFDEILALWVYHPREKRLYLRLPDRAKPEGSRLSWVPSRNPLVRISETENVTVEGLTLAHGGYGVWLDQARDCVVRNVTITSFEDTGIVLTAGATRCTIQGCDITRGSLEEWRPPLEHSRGNYEIWQLHKSAGYSDRNGIVLLRAGADNRVLENHLHRVFDGIALGDYKAESLDIPLPDPAHCQGAEIARNLIENTRDSGIELGAGSVDVKVHHNTLRQTHGGLRFKLPRLGPLYIHHNRLIDGSPFNVWFSMDASPAEAYVYHNTVVGGHREFLEVSRDSRRRDFVAPKWHFLNNLTLNDRGFCEPSEKPALDFTTSHNISGGKERPWPEGTPDRDTGSRYGVEISHDANGKPAPGSPAIDAGLDLSTYLDGKPLPGCEPGYFLGKAPDVGADEVE